ncbi:hypothetical protein PPERSA_06446 [Pseudocohnilembus persalinus]|uniref:Uncharacterized protein n=1 Tax=Pseudocohnilembus persalinus TaxID=266149 RepID=A0A0V0QRJ5_PSEPJ|nr:hypothetical protein PPERSA_06446 [Pseudocohnilembus persalinus]|eukprot:KRX04812.1 hypothetical protein PPERSA_06446 [Pseudocohnilembus persalinus]
MAASNQNQIEKNKINNNNKIIQIQNVSQSSNSYSSNSDSDSSSQSIKKQTFYYYLEDSQDEKNSSFYSENGEQIKIHKFKSLILMNENLNFTVQKNQNLLGHSNQENFYRKNMEEFQNINKSKINIDDQLIESENCEDSICKLKDNCINIQGIDLKNNQNTFFINQMKTSLKNSSINFNNYNTIQNDLNKEDNLKINNKSWDSIKKQQNLQSECLSPSILQENSPTSYNSQIQLTNLIKKYDAQIEKNNIYSDQQQQVKNQKKEEIIVEQLKEIDIKNQNQNQSFYQLPIQSNNLLEQNDPKQNWAFVDQNYSKNNQKSQNKIFSLNDIFKQADQNQISNFDVQKINKFRQRRSDYQQLKKNSEQKFNQKYVMFGQMTFDKPNLL